jgi:hypothetical protein
MGYTHYFQLHEEPTPTRWESFTRGVNQLIDESDVPVLAKTDENRVLIEGVGENAHETFYIERGSIRWNFCKTARKPYDELVTAVLILARYTFDSFSLSSDGNWSDWVLGRELFTRVKRLEPAEDTVFGNQEHKYDWDLENA